MGACKSCGEPAGALKSLCGNCATRENEAREQAISDRRRRLGALDGVAAFDALFRLHPESVGEGCARLAVSVPNPTNVLVDGGWVGLTTTGVAFANPFEPTATFMGHKYIRDVVVGANLEIGMKSSWGSTTVVSEHSIWFKFIFLDLQISQFHFPVIRGNEHTFIDPTRWFMALNDFIPVTVQDQTVMYVWRALLTEPFNERRSLPGRAMPTDE